MILIDTMKIDNKLINHLSLLARLESTESEKEGLAKNLTEILDYAEKLKSIDTNNIEPLVHTFEKQNVFRKDESQPSLSRDETLKNAPDKEAGFFRVPRVIE